MYLRFIYITERSEPLSALWLLDSRRVVSGYFEIDSKEELMA